MTRHAEQLTNGWTAVSRAVVRHHRHNGFWTLARQRKTCRPSRLARIASFSNPCLKRTYSDQTVFNLKFVLTPGSPERHYWKVLKSCNESLCASGCQVLCYAITYLLTAGRKRLIICHLALPIEGHGHVRKFLRSRDDMPVRLPSTSAARVDRYAT